MINDYREKFDFSIKSTAKHHGLTWAMVKRWIEEEQKMKVQTTQSDRIRKRNIKHKSKASHGLKYPILDDLMFKW